MSGTGIISGLLGAFFPPAPEPLDEVDLGRIAVVRGRVLPRDLLRSPLTGAECVYYSYTIEEWRRSSIGAVGGDGFWQITERDEAIAEFYLQDGKTRAVVSPFAARVEPRRGAGPRPVDLRMPGRRALELLISPGDPLEVVGRVDRVDDLFDDGRDYRGSPTVLCLRAPPGESLLVRIL
ncbi:MAG TPA: hypothetical protein VEL05_05350 [Candidatus Acidoferrum sp.]|nr:hypothetical protein [Candidatus Acidoferrum sp.]